MRAALGGVDVVGKREQALAVSVGVLHRDLRHGVVARTLDIDDLRMNRGLVAVQILDKLLDAALIVHDILADILRVALVAQSDADAAVEERLLAQTLFQYVILVLQRLKNLIVGAEADGGSRLMSRARNGFHLLYRLTAFKPHGVLVFPVVYRRLQPFGQRIDDRGADTVQTAGDLVAVAAELAAGVQNGENNLQCRNTHLRMDADRDAASVVAYPNDIIRFNCDFNVSTIAGERLIDGVVDNLVYEMMQAARRGRTDVHTRTHSDRLQTLQDLNLAFIVGLLYLQIEDLFSQNFFTHVNPFSFSGRQYPDVLSSAAGERTETKQSRLSGIYPIGLVGDYSPSAIPLRRSSVAVESCEM